jgi:hypothetical protein
VRRKELVRGGEGEESGEDLLCVTTYDNGIRTNVDTVGQARARWAGSQRSEGEQCLQPWIRRSR